MCWFNWFIVYTTPYLGEAETLHTALSAVEPNLSCCRAVYFALLQEAARTLQMREWEVDYNTCLVVETQTKTGSYLLPYLMFITLRFLWSMLLNRLTIGL